MIFVNLKMLIPETKLRAKKRTIDRKLTLPLLKVCRHRKSWLLTRMTVKVKRPIHYIMNRMKNGTPIVWTSSANVSMRYTAYIHTKYRTTSGKTHCFNILVESS